MTPSLRSAEYGIKIMFGGREFEAGRPSDSDDALRGVTLARSMCRMTAGVSVSDPFKTTCTKETLAREH